MAAKVVQLAMTGSNGDSSTAAMPPVTFAIVTSLTAMTRCVYQVYILIAYWTQCISIIQLIFTSAGVHTTPYYSIFHSNTVIGKMGYLLVWYSKLLL